MLQSPAGLLRRGAAWVAAVAILLSSTGCASPFRFSPRLDTHLPRDGAASPLRTNKLAGDLDLALAALMDQRRELWQAAGETEHMKNLTALGIIGLSSYGLYKGLQGEQSRGWLTRAGLLASATYAGANFLQPSARQSIYLEGAKSLTCLALATASYEMTSVEYDKIKDDIANSRRGLEQLATTLRLVGRYGYKTDTWWLVRGGWNKLRWAGRVLQSADAALGTIEQTGPRLRDMTALLASDVATQVNRVSKDLSDLPAALATLKPNTNLLIGSEIFVIPDKDKVDQDPPKGAGEAPADKKQEGDKGKEKDAASKDPECTAPPAPAAAASAPKASTPSPKKASTETADERQKREDLFKQLTEATAKLDASLGPVISFVERVAAARRGMTLPPACGASAVSLVPGKRDLVLQPGETFQFVLQGDNGKASADFLGSALAHDVLDISMPLAQAATAVRLTAGTKATKPVNTVVRISDSRGQQNFDITVKVCPGTP